MEKRKTLMAQNLVLFEDTDCDNRPEVAEQLGYRLISMPYTIDGQEVFPYETSKDIDIHAFYERLRTGNIPKTSGLSPEKYLSYFEPFFQEGKDILYVHFSSKLSGTFNAMNLAVSMLQEKYPMRRFHALDTKAITGLALLLLYRISDLWKEGKTAEEIIDITQNDLIPHNAFYAFVDNLKYFKASGRLSGLSATMGDVLGIKPIISIDSEGKMGAIDKVLGRLSALKKIMAYLDKLGDHVAENKIVVVHSDAPKLADQLIQMIQSRYGKDLDIVLEPVNPTAGIHAGPNCVGVAFHAKNRDL